MKKLISLILVLATFTVLLTACVTPQDGDGLVSDTETDVVTEPLSTVSVSTILRSAFPSSKAFSSSVGCEEVVIGYVANKDNVIKKLVAEDFSVLETDGIEGAKTETIVLTRGNDVVTIYWDKSSNQMRVMWESNVSTEPLKPNSETGKGSVLVAQIGTERDTENDNPLNGMCYVIKLSNGRAIVIDGGFNNDYCADNIYNTLGKMDIAKTGDGKYIIEAWIFSHAHGDHNGAVGVFAEKYSKNADVVYYMHNFPVDGELVAGMPDITEFSKIWLESFPGATRVDPHAGLKYYFGNVTIDMLYTPDMVYAYNKQVDYFNDTSLIYKLTAGGSSVLFYGDAAENASIAMWDAYDSTAFKSDILQITHHGLYTQANASHKWDTLKKVYEATEAKYAFLPMHSKYGPDTRNGRYTVMIQWCNAGYQVSYVMNEKDNHGDTNITQAEYEAFVKSVANGTNTYDTLYGYDGINKIVNEQGMVTYTGGNNDSPMVTIFSLSDGKATLDTNMELYSWLGISNPTIK